jgi:cardiolipin synthase
MAHSLIVLPEDSPKPILDAIHRSSKALRIKMFLLSDPTLLNALIGAHHRGVHVRVMLNPVRRNGEVENEESRRLLSAAGVEVIDSNPAFDLTHEKSLIVDETEALVQSLNWQTKNLISTRDFAVLTTQRDEVQEIVECFEADWNRVNFTRRERSNVIWCTGSGRERLAEFIDRAAHNLFVENERYQDPVIIERLVRAKRRGVEGPYSGASAPQAEKGQTPGGRGWTAHHARRRDQDPQAQTPGAACQDALCGQRRGHHRINQSDPRQL